MRPFSWFSPCGSHGVGGVLIMVLRSFATATLQTEVLCRKFRCFQRSDRILFLLQQVSAALRHGSQLGLLFIPELFHLDREVLCFGFGIVAIDSNLGHCCENAATRTPRRERRPLSETFYTREPAHEV